MKSLPLLIVVPSARVFHQPAGEEFLALERYRLKCQLAPSNARARIPPRVEPLEGFHQLAKRRKCQ
jgi:hypothetical protein